SLALFAFLVPIMGLNMTPVIFGLVIYTQLPIIRNVYVGLTNIDQSIIDAARGMGLTGLEINLKVRFPLALPVIFAGVRTAVVLGIGIGAIAAYIGAGGLGVYIFQGINRGIMNMVLVAAILVALISLVVDRLLQLLQRAAEKRIS
ncbi:MAG TPA: ABC transporter permease, partial [Flexilinea sp.]|nr:ABC transporter permease [Flexilinea sp.]